MFTLLALSLVAALEGVDLQRLNRIDAVVEAAIAAKKCPGAVVVVVHQDEIVYRKAFGLRIVGDFPVKMTADSIFDLASLTKPIATATSVGILIEQGKLRLSDPVAKHWPAFAANGKEAVTVEQCLLHTTGLIADNSIKDYTGTRAEMLGRIAELPLEAPAGTRFKYSDVGFIVLGKLVERISGEQIDSFTAKTVFGPLKMKDTGYKPAEAVRLLIAPTSLRDKKLIFGDVHDPRAFALGGVAGHAGLFGTADDLSRFCRMLLNGGSLDGTRVLSPLGVKLLTEPRPVPGGLRSRGWDVDTVFSAPRGDLFPAGDGFGHTGFTGTSLWLDPQSRTAIIILTNRVHPDEKGNVTELRRQIGTLVAAAIESRREK